MVGGLFFYKIYFIFHQGYGLKRIYSLRFLLYLFKKGSGKVLLLRRNSYNRYLYSILVFLVVF